MFTLGIELYETENGTLVVSSEAIRSENLVELLRMATAASAEMFREFAGGRTGTAGGQQNKSMTANTYSDNQSDNQYEDFTTGQRWGTFGLNILPGGLGSFLIMKDNVGGGIKLGTDVVFVASLSIMIISVEPDFEHTPYATSLVVIGISSGLVGGQIFNAIRSYTYHKPKPKSAANANNFKPYDGLKLAVVPAESGDFKVVARYDYSF